MKHPYSLKSFATLLLTVCLVVGSITAQAQKATIAILPFELTSNDGGLIDDARVTEIQNTCVNAMRDYANKINVQDIRTTNAILAKNNVTWQDLSKVLPTDIAKMLGVEYVLFGTANIQNKGTNTNSSSSTSYRDKNDQKKTSSSKNSKSSGYAVSNSTTTTTTKYETRISLDIYINSGNNIHSVSRTAFSSDLNGYISTIEYLAKRTPWGKKYKG